MADSKLLAASNKCLTDRENIPGAPLWHMGKVAIFGSKESFDLLQNTIDYLTCKGKLAKAFTSAEKEFMKELFEALWWGGKYHGFDEAAKLANHYVNGKGKAFTIDSKVYTDSVIVADAMRALKAHMLDLVANKKPIVMLKSSDVSFRNSPHAKVLAQRVRNVNTQGHILGDGALLVEQSNQRLKNADHRFHLTVSTSKNGSSFLSRWKVASKYDFEPFKKGYVTDIPLTKGMTLKLPDGLSHYLTKVGVANEFEYGSQWQEMWK